LCSRIPYLMPFAVVDVSDSSQRSAKLSLAVKATLRVTSTKIYDFKWLTSKKCVRYVAKGWESVCTGRELPQGGDEVNCLPAVTARYIWNSSGRSWKGSTYICLTTCVSSFSNINYFKNTSVS
jgi:hypothetical protein